MSLRQPRTKLSSSTALSNTAGKISMMAMLVAGTLLAPTKAHAIDANELPQNGTVVGGDASFDYSQPNKLDVHQTTDRTVINWDSFNIGTNATTQFYQPGKDSLAVNRVYSKGVDPTQILGKLIANGKVMVLDRNGVFIGKDAVVNVGGVIASTGEIDAAQVMSGSSKIDITDISDAAVINEGTINVEDAGLVGFVAKTVINRGIINAKMGQVVLASGRKATIDLYGDNLIEITAGEDLQNALVDNKGIITAQGGTVQLTTGAAKNAVDNVVNMDGIVDVSSVEVKGGKIILSGGTVNVTGKLKANGKTGGGKIDVKGKNITVTKTAEINADATTAGDGGKVDLIAQDVMTFDGLITARGGEISGNGGNVEVSGYEGLAYTGLANLTAANGDMGNLLLDPKFMILYNGTVPTGLAQQYLISTTTLIAQLLFGNVTLQADDFIDVGTKNGTYAINTGAGSFVNGIVNGILNGLPDGGVDISNAFGVPTSGNLTLKSSVVNFNRDLKMGNGDLIVNAGSTINWNANVTSTGGSITGTSLGANNINSVLKTNGGNVTLSGVGANFWDTGINLTVNAEIDTNGGDINLTSSNSKTVINGKAKAGTGDLNIKAINSGRIEFWGAGELQGNNVDLQSDLTITQGASGKITANTLTGSSKESTTLDGQNIVGKLGTFSTGSVANVGGFLLNNVSGTRFDVNGAVTSKGGNVSVANNGEVRVVSAGSVVSNGGDISLSNNGAASFIYVDGVVNSGAGDTTIDSTSNIQLRNGSEVTADQLTLKSGNNIGQTAGSKIVANTLTGSVDKAASLLGTANDIANLGTFTTGVSAFHTGGFTLVDTNGLNIDGAVSSDGGNIALETSGTLRLKAAGSVVSKGGSVQLKNTTNQMYIAGTIDAVGATRGNVTLDSVSNIELQGASKVLGGTVTTNSGNIVTQVATSQIVADKLQGSVDKNAEFLGLTNDIVALGDFTTGVSPFHTGVFKLFDSANGLTIDGVVSTDGGNIDIDSNDAFLVLNNSMTTTGGKVTLTAGGTTPWGYTDGVHIANNGVVSTSGGDIKLVSKNSKGIINGKVLAGAGDVTVQAINGGRIEFWGAGEIQGDDVNLQSDLGISQGTSGKITANILTGSSKQGASLEGQNVIGKLGVFTTGDAFNAGGFLLNNVSGTRFDIIGAVTSQGGAITVDHKGELRVVAAGSTVSNGGNIKLANNGGGAFIYIDGTVNSGTGDTTIDATSNIELRNNSKVTANKLITKSGNNINQNAGSKIVAQRLEGSVSKTASFLGTANDIATLGGFATGTSAFHSGGFTLVDSANGLNIDGAISTDAYNATRGDITISTVGDLALTSNGAVNASGGNINLFQTGKFSSVNANSVKTNGTGKINLVQNAGGSIQNAIDALDNIGNGQNTIVIGDGIFNEALKADHKNLHLDGDGTVFSTHIVGPNDGTGTGITVSADNVNLTGMVFEKWYNGIAVATGTVNDLSMDDIVSRNNTNAGFFVGGAATVDGLTVTNSHFDDNNTRIGNTNDYGFGWYIQKSGVNGSNVTNVTVTDTTFSGNALKGIYAEKLDNATFKNVDVIGSGIWANNPSHNAGIDLNLKFGDYANITFDDLTIASSGLNATDLVYNVNRVESGLGIWVKARNDGPTYSVSPASLTGLTIKNSNITAGGDVAVAISGNVDHVDVIGNTNITGKQALAFFGGVTDVNILNNIITSAGGDSTGVYDGSLSADSFAVSLKDADNVVIQKNTISGGKTGVKLNNVSDVTIGGSLADKNTIQNAVSGWGSAGINIVNGSSIVISFNDLLNNGGQAIFAEGPYAGPLTTLDITNNKIESSEYNAIFLKKWNGAKVAANEITAVAFGDGVQLELAENTTVVGNTIKNAANAGVNLSYGNTSTTIQGNTLTDNKYGVRLGNVGAGTGSAETLIGSFDGDVAKVNVISGGTTGIMVDGGGNLWIQDNTISGTSDAGIDVANSGGAYNIINFNRINNVTNDGIRLSKTTSLVADNRIGTAGTIGGYGIISDQSDDSRIASNLVYDASLDGIKVTSSDGVTVDGNDVKNADRVGIYAAYATNLEIRNNKVDNTTFLIGTPYGGISTDFGSDITISKNTITNGTQGVRVYSAGGVNLIDQNKIDTMTDDGIFVSASANTTVSKNKIGSGVDGILNNADDTVIGGNGVTILSSANAVVDANKIAHALNGVYADGAGNIRVYNNDIADAAINGIYVKNSGGTNYTNDADIWKNRITDSATADGIRVENSAYATVGAHNNNQYGETDGYATGNVISDVKSGIVIVGSTNSMTRYNTVSNASENGVNVISSANSTIRNNRIGTAGLAGNIIGEGILIQSSANSTVRNNTVKFVDDDGVVVRGSNGSTVFNNTVEEVSGNGILIGNSDLANVDSNTVTNVGKDGVRVNNSNRVDVVSNSIDTGLNGIRINNSNRAYVFDNTIDNTVDAGIYVINSNTADILNNFVGTNGGAFNIGTDGISIELSDDAFVQGNDIADATDNGIKVANGDFASVVSNTVTRSGKDGIRINSSRQVGVASNTISDAGLNGIRINNSNRATVESNTIDNVADAGIYVFSSNRADIFDNFIGTNGGASNIGTDGISIELSDNATIQGNEITDTTDNGIKVVGSVDVKIGGAPAKANTISNAGLDGIRLNGADGAFVRNNSITSVGNNGINVLNSTGPGFITISDNTIDDTGLDGIRISATDDAVISGNTIGYNASIGRDGIRAIDSSNLDITGNLIANVRNGIYVSGNGGPVSGNLISGNTINDTSRTAIRIVESDTTDIINNLIGLLGGNNNIGRDGILVELSDNVNVQGNEIDETRRSGVRVLNSDFATIDTNTITDANRDGIRLINANTALVQNNDINAVRLAGIYADNSADTTISNNIIENADLYGVNVLNASGVTVIDGNEINTVGTDGINVNGAVDLRIEGNMIGLGADQLAGTLDDTTVGNDGVYVANSLFTQILDNMIANAVRSGVYLEDLGASTAVVSGNEVTNSTTAMTFESGLIDLTGDANTLTGGSLGLRFAPKIGNSVNLVGNTIGTTIFETPLYIELSNGALFNPGTPTVIDATNASFDGFIPNTVPGLLLTQAQYDFIEDRIFHFNDAAGLGLFFFGFPPSIDQSDIFRDIAGIPGIAGRFSITIRGLPRLPGTTNGTQTFSLNDITPAAGGDNATNPAALNEISTAAGDEAGATTSSCWSDAVAAAGSGQTVTYGFGGDGSDAISGAAACGANPS